jgi:hypothetical protein
MAFWDGETWVEPKPADSDLHRMGYENPFGYEDGYQEGYAQGRRHGFTDGYAEANQWNWFANGCWFLVGMGLGGLWMGVMVG